MNEVIPVNKPFGVTSYDVIRELKKQYPHQKIGHAGTLDPLASGILICLIGSGATRRQSEFMNVSKDYEFDVLFGVGTDTFDILGLITNPVASSTFSTVMPNETPVILNSAQDPTLVGKDEDLSPVMLNSVQHPTPKAEYSISEIKKAVEENLHHFKGKYLQKVPPFSAVKIDGRELYRWYLDGRINEIQIPEKEIEVEDINILNMEEISKQDLEKRITDLVDLVKSGFRQKLVLESWQKYFAETKQENFLVVKIKATVSKGTYVRAIANDLGNRIGLPACTITITRTRVGDFKLPS